MSTEGVVEKEGVRHVVGHLVRPVARREVVKRARHDLKLGTSPFPTDEC